MEQFKAQTLSTPTALSSNYYLPGPSATGFLTNGFSNYNMSRVSMPLPPPGYNAAVSNRKYRRDRIIFTKKQLETLEALFTQTQFPDCESRQRIAQQTQLDIFRVQTWFKNRRARMRQQAKQDKHMIEWKRQVLADQDTVSSPLPFVNLVTVIKSKPAASVETAQSSGSSVKRVRSKHEYTDNSTPTFESNCPVKTYYKSDPNVEEDCSFDRLFSSG